ncbi:UvrB/UvrC motif-containing protein [Patescibacteria group bacterium]
MTTELRGQMMEYANNHEFERAEVIKNQIESVRVLDEKQIVRE